MVICQSCIFEKVYGFSNENLKSYEQLLNFTNAKVLSVIGSGDQYFSAILYGASKVTLFDINNCAYYYFILKFYAIKILSYEEFVKLFLKTNLDDNKLYMKVYPYLPVNTRAFFDAYLKHGNKLSNLRLRQDFQYGKDVFATSKISSQIPYLNRTDYYRLQQILKAEKLPEVILSDLLNLKKMLSERYDILLLSNIYLYLDCNVLEFSKLLASFNSGVVQAHYIWGDLPNQVKEFKKEGYSAYEVEGHFDDNKDTVLIYKL